MEEIELKFRLHDASAHGRLRETLTRLGATPSPPQTEANLLFDDAAGSLTKASTVLRVREIDGGPAGALTFKGSARMTEGVKTRAEFETRISDVTAARALLEALGYRVTLTYHKLREAWQLGDVEVALDALEFGTFCEIEGPEAAIREVASALNLDPAEAEPRGYPSLSREWAARIEQ